ncbi:AAA-like domain-containing protein [Iningainema tapete]|uniref:AAA-like domain-containing protein n=1 Tax=Iningainema tapete BLCC-T55 TaxID=2748662 RepID=A0A8J7C0B6_9CYAN|nr:AAA-like domain-containing protein [Iningainema tapete]MBD2777738.1 AAA-like domain-containing protein [Iningainema tapete BLCC-T55]
MTVDEVINLLKVSLPEGLTPLQEVVLRSTWEGKTYADMAAETNYVKEYLSRTASELWSSLSDFWGEPIGKNNFRRVFESRPLNKEQQQTLLEFRRQSTTSGEFPGGPVSLDSKFYIERPPIDVLAYEEVTKPGSIIRIRAPWKMGKTSLMLRILAHAEAQKYRTVTIDFQQAEKTVFSDIDKFFRWFSTNITRKLQLEPKLDVYWDVDMGSKVSCTIYFEAYILEQIKRPLVLGLNEVNRVFEYPQIAEEFFSLLRSWYEQATTIKIWQKLRLVLTYSTDVYIQLQINQSPFNVGLPLKLPLFTPDEVMTLASRHGLEWTNAQNKQLMGMVGGHPYLLQLAFYYMHRRELILKQLLQEAATESGIYNDHLRRLLAFLQAEPALENAFKQVISAEQPLKLVSPLAYKLDSLGLVNINGDFVTHSCELYRLYFKNQLL